MLVASYMDQTCDTVILFLGSQDVVDSIFILLQNDMKVMKLTMYSPVPLVSIVTGGYLCVLSLYIKPEHHLSLSGARGG